MRLGRDGGQQVEKPRRLVPYLRVQIEPQTKSQDRREIALDRFLQGKMSIGGMH